MHTHIALYTISLIKFCSILLVAHVQVSFRPTNACIYKYQIDHTIIQYITFYRSNIEHN